MGCLDKATEMLSPRSISTGGGLDGFLHHYVADRLRNDLENFKMGTPLRTSEARVRVKRARQIL